MQGFRRYSRKHSESATGTNRVVLGSENRRAFRTGVPPHSVLSCEKVSRTPCSYIPAGRYRRKLASMDFFTVPTATSRVVFVFVVLARQ
jgi:hypothetical protein